MSDNTILEPADRHPILSVFLFLIVLALGFVVVGPMIGFVLALPFYDGSMMELADAMQTSMTDPALKLPLYIMQACATFIGLIVGPAWFLKTERQSAARLLRTVPDLVSVVLIVVLVIVFAAVNSVFIEWNSNFTFPEFAKEFEQWAREKEEIAAQITTFLTRFKSVGEVILAVFVIAVLPAIGEELAFRGIIQNRLLQATRNAHVAIWISAILFSAIHFQFFGFVPRLLLGALFGYLYYWSGNLWLAILAHFVNNGFSVVAMYFYQQGTLDIDLESTESVPPNVFVVCCLLTAALLYYFYQFFKNRKPHPDSL